MAKTNNKKKQNRSLSKLGLQHRLSSSAANERMDGWMVG